MDIVSPTAPACEFQGYDPNGQYAITEYECTVAAPVTFEVTTPRSNLNVQYCGPADVIGGDDVCDPAVIGQSGPDGNGLYHYFVRLVAAPQGEGNILTLRAGGDAMGIYLNVTANEVNPFGELAYVMRKVTAIKGGVSCRISSSMSYYMLAPQIWGVILKLQKRRAGKWRTVQSDGFQDTYTPVIYRRHRFDSRVTVSKNALRKGKWRTRVTQEVYEQPFPPSNPYHYLTETRELKAGMC